MDSTKSNFLINLFSYSDYNKLLEQKKILPESSNVETVGVCFSGGGSRALSAAMGQLRGLKYLGLLDKTQFISGVSGGAWASSIYSFLPESISDDDLLGGVCSDPSLLTWDQDSRGGTACELDYLSPNNMGRIPGGMSIAKLLSDAINMYDSGTPESEIWVRLVGEYIFKPYGLYSGYGTSKYYIWNKAWFDAFVAPKNPGLTIDDFYIYPADRYRPSLFIFGSLIPDQTKGDYELIPIMFSPFFSGVMADFPSAGINGEDIGGGGVDSFGFNAASHAYYNSEVQQIAIPRCKFSIADMAGISSSFFAEIISAQHPDFDGLIPEYPYWPVLNVDNNPSKTYGFADGGNLDNSGVASMLRQGLDNIISFLNTSVPLNYDHDLLLVMVDDQVPPLFGFQPYKKGYGYVPYSSPLVDPSFAVFKENQVFESSQFQTFLISLWNAYTSGGTAMCYQENLSVLANPKFGVPSGTVNMLWVYNNKVTNWESQLSDYVKIGMDTDPILYGSFPNYNTADIGLTSRQVNLLAHLSCWNIISDNRDGNQNGITNAQVFQKMYAPKS